MNRTTRAVGNAVYGLGSAITACLASVALFGPDQPVNPDSMLAMTWQEQAFICLALGALPMLMACMAAYALNGFDDGTNRLRDLCLVFIPGFICSGCALFCTAVIVIGYVNMLLGWI
jgi:hypothetical protein